MFLAAQHWRELDADASDRILAADNLVLIALCYRVLKALHEFGHGYAVKAFGGAVHEVGVMFLVFAPVPYVDASAGVGVSQQVAARARRRRRHDRRGVSSRRWRCTSGLPSSRGWFARSPITSC